MLARLADIQVVALRGVAASDTPFFSATVVGRTGDGRLMELARFQGDDVEGVQLADADLQAAVSGGDATLLATPIAAQTRVVAWFAADGEEVEAELRATAAWFHPVPQEHGKAFLVRRPESDAVRATLHQRHQWAARLALRSGDANQALDHADRAWLLALRVEPLDVALLVEATRRVRGGEEAESVLESERRSHGEVFVSVVQRALLDLKPLSTRDEARLLQRVGLRAQLAAA